MNVHTECLMLAVLALGSLRTFAGVLGQNSLGVEELPLAMMGLQRSQGLPLISVKTTPPPTPPCTSQFLLYAPFSLSLTQFLLGFMQYLKIHDDLFKAGPIILK